LNLTHPIAKPGSGEFGKLFRRGFLKQLAIELYQPRTGGLAIGGKFAPGKMKVQPKKELPGK